MSAQSRRVIPRIKRFSRRLLGSTASGRAGMDVSGYSTVPAVAAGSELALHLGARRAGVKRLEVTRVGTTKVSGEFVADVPQLVPPSARAWEGYGWPVTASFAIPADWPSGLYGVMHDGQAVLSFVVLEPASTPTARVLCHIPVLTAAAYEPAGGKSLYGFNSAPDGVEGDRAQAVSLHRPWAWDPLGFTQTVRLQSLIEWFDDEGLAVDYCSSLELDAEPERLARYDCLVLPGHDEYWTRAMRANVEQFVDGGGNLAVLSGNTCYRVVRLEDDRRLVRFTKYVGDDVALADDDVTVAFADPPLHDPQNTFIGVGCAQGAMEGELSAYTIRQPDHWVFDGIGDARTTSAFMNYETDAAAYVEEPEGYPRVTGDDGSPLTSTLLATADLRTWAGKPGRATMTIFSKHGTVFNAATTEWVDALDDPVVARVTRNVLARLSQRRERGWTEIGAAPDIVACTAAGGRLLGATSAGSLVQRHPVGAEVTWRDVGTAAVVSLASDGVYLFGFTAGNDLVCRSTIERDEPWRVLGPGPRTRGIALGAMGGMLYAGDQHGVLWQCAGEPAEPRWHTAPIPSAGAPLRALTGLHGVLLAATSDGRLLRSNTDHLSVDSRWIEAGHVDGDVTGLAVVEWMLFASTSERLAALDLWRWRVGRTPAST